MRCQPLRLSHCPRQPRMRHRAGKTGTALGMRRRRGRFQFHLHLKQEHQPVRPALVAAPAYQAGSNANLTARCRKRVRVKPSANDSSFRLDGNLKGAQVGTGAPLLPKTACRYWAAVASVLRVRWCACPRLFKFIAVPLPNFQATPVHGSSY